MFHKVITELKTGNPVLEILLYTSVTGRDYSFNFLQFLVLMKLVRDVCHGWKYFRRIYPQRKCQNNSYVSWIIGLTV